MSKPILEFDNVSKLYMLGQVGTGALYRDLNRWWRTSIMRQEDPYMKIGEVNDRTAKGSSGSVWALKDISFKVEEGDVVGIIGKNGAGKSTLLKLLSRITAPSKGRIITRGRIASLLEVGTGFHPDLTGRENIYMNGSIMGMTRKEITSKLDEIVDFAGVARYLDTPTKRYSSGMIVRLGFAVAAFLEPEILVVDEVLAVGDAEFQKKALGKMQNISQTQGRTVLFVSHNMAAVKNLCKNGVVLNNGEIKFQGKIIDCVNYYQKTNIEEIKNFAEGAELKHANFLAKELEYCSVRIINDPFKVATLEPLEFEFLIKRNDKSIKECQFGILARNETDDLIWACYSSLLQLPKDKDRFKIKIKIPKHNTPKGRYKLNFNISKYDYNAVIRDIDIIYEALSFEVNYIDLDHKLPFTMWPFKKGCVIMDSTISAF